VARLPFVRSVVLISIATQLVGGINMTPENYVNRKDALKKQVNGDHYRKLKIQPIEYITANDLGFIEGNIVKYVTRHKEKGGINDVDKIIHYAELLKDLYYFDNDRNK